MAGIAAALPLFFSFPIINYLARTQGFTPTLWIAVGIQIVLSIMPSLSYGAWLLLHNAVELLIHLGRRYFHFHNCCIS